MESNAGIKGQASVEFIFTLLIAVMFIVALVQPSAELAANSTKDVSNLSKLKVSAEKLADTIQFVALSGEGTKQAINLIVPEGAAISCLGTNLITQYALLSNNGENDVPEASCPSGICTNILNVGTGFNCTGEPDAGLDGDSKLIVVTVEKFSTEVSIIFEEF